MNAVIIGAGKTGRGFIGPLLQKNNCKITFIDKNEKLIANLNEHGTYDVYYFGDKKEKNTINAFNAYSIKDKNAIDSIKNADLVFISVFANNVSSLINILKKGIEERIKENELSIICCENGIDVSKPLLDSGINALITEGIIFCTTINYDNTLNLISETYPEIPIDNKDNLLKLDLKGFKLINDYSTLIQRKIYTYNFMSALIAYLGSYAGYEIFGQASNDDTINLVIEKMAPIISNVVGKEYSIDYAEQSKFTNIAINKFKNKEITDTVERNAAHASRKLEYNERLLKPLELIEKYDEESKYLLLVIASAIYYGMKYEELNEEIVFDKIRKLANTSTTLKVIDEYLGYMKNNTSLEKIISYVDNICYKTYKPTL